MIRNSLLSITEDCTGLCNIFSHTQCFIGISSTCMNAFRSRILPIWNKLTPMRPRKKQWVTGKYLNHSHPGKEIETLRNIPLDVYKRYGRDFTQNSLTSYSIVFIITKKPRCPPGNLDQSAKILVKRQQSSSYSIAGKRKWHSVWAGIDAIHRWGCFPANWAAFHSFGMEDVGRGCATVYEGMGTL